MSSSRDVAGRVEQRSLMMQEFKARLDGAQRSEERHVVVEEIRTQLLATAPKAADGKSTKENLAAAKAKVRDNPELLAKLDRQEARLLMSEQLKAKLQEAASAEGAQKEELLEQASVLRETLSQSIRQERDAAMAKKQAQPAAERAEAIEKHKQDLEELRRALREVAPNERIQALEAWRAEQMAEMEKAQ